ncbi:MAG: SDR family NAD(P)-dependent oxidoreductase, partial [Pirellulales bacterium]|nr:SDR family NAD(P)-dependent oxidoreductase [Pirellulales bacterium]
FDADLEADLGIDSIKKAQLFGELGDRFQIAPQEHLSLDDFPTMEHVLDFLVVELAGQNGAPPSESGPTARAPDAAPTRGPLAPLPPEAAAAGPLAAAAAPHADELRKILVEFVVDQTGYPEEIIEFDADLEADLGIDSIKKAQLFGELGDRFQIAPQEHLSLDDFPTLEHVLDFLVVELAGQNGAPAATARSAPAPAADEAVEKDDFVKIHVSQGDPSRPGRDRGRALKASIQSEMACLVDFSMTTEDNPQERWPGAWAEEISGLAEGAQVNRMAAVLWNLRGERLSCLRTSFGEIEEPASWPLDRNTVTLVQLRKGCGQDYLTIGRPGRVTGTAGINAARIICSCEPLDEQVAPGDVVAVAVWLHETLGTAETLNDAASRVSALRLRGRWCVAISAAGSGMGSAWRCGGGHPVRDDSARTREQVLLHQGINDHPDELRLFDRCTMAVERVPLDSILGTSPGEPARRDDSRSPVVESLTMHRHVMQTVASPRPAPGEPVYRQGDSVWLVGTSATSQPLGEQLSSRGCRVESFSANRVRAVRERLRGGETPGHLIFLEDSAGVSLDAFSASESYLERFELCRLWIESLENAGAIARASIAAVTRLGGDLGFQRDVPVFSGGGMTGLLKGIRREYPSLYVKVVDFDGSSGAAAIASEFVAEMDSGDRQLEVGICSAQRCVVQALAQPVPQGRTDRIKRGGVWVVSGGGRGVTSAVARQLGGRFGLRLHLLGTSPRPAQDAVWKGRNQDQLRDLKRRVAIEAREAGESPARCWSRIEKAIELDRNLEAFASAGVQATYHVCDVGNRASLKRVLDQIRATEGAIDGIIHGAGIEAACRFTRKQQDLVRATIASKSDGALNLIALTRSDPLECFVSFGSTSGRFGGLGQADYSLASDLLAKISDRLAVERPGCKVLTFHWPAWDELGMAVRPESKLALQSSGISFMPVREGVDHLFRELSTDDRQREILILDKPGLLDTDGTMSRRVPADGQPPTSGSARRVPPPRAAGLDCSRASLIASMAPSDRPGRYLARWPLDATNDPFLVNHRLRQRPFLPGVMSLEAMVEAAAILRPAARFVGFRDVQLVNGWSIDPARDHEATLVLTETDDGVRCELTGILYNTRHEVVEENRLLATGLVLLDDEPALIEAADPGKPILDWHPFLYPEEFVMFHGPPYRTLTRIALQHGGGHAMIEGRPRNELIGARSGDGMLTAAAALDGCMYACGSFVFFMVDKSVEIPRGIDSYRQARLPREGEKCALRLFYRGPAGRGSLYDFNLVGEPGDAILEVKGYRSVRLENGNVD